MAGASSSFEIAWAAHSAGEYERCIDVLREAVERDDDACRVALAELYLDGCPGLAPSTPKALELLHAAAARTNLTAIAKLGQLYFRGSHGVPANHQRAFEFARFAALNGRINSMVVLSTMYGACGELDHEGAWLTIAAQHGHGKAIEIVRAEPISRGAKTIAKRYMELIEQLETLAREDPIAAFREADALQRLDIPNNEPATPRNGCMGSAAVLIVAAIAALMAVAMET